MNRIALAVVVSSLGLGASASARCNIHNDTGYSFTVESGTTSNQRLGGHTTTTIAPGKVIARSDDGKHSFGGMCTDGMTVEVKEDHGVVIMMPK
jgi:hypothetical protein